MDNGDGLIVEDVATVLPFGVTSKVGGPRVSALSGITYEVLAFSVTGG